MWSYSVDINLKNFNQTTLWSSRNSLQCWLNLELSVGFLFNTTTMRWGRWNVITDIWSILPLHFSNTDQCCRILGLGNTHNQLSVQLECFAYSVRHLYDGNPFRTSPKLWSPKGFWVQVLPKPPALAPEQGIWSLLRAFSLVINSDRKVHLLWSGGSEAVHFKGREFSRRGFFPQYASVWGWIWYYSQPVSTSCALHPPSAWNCWKRSTGLRSSDIGQNSGLVVSGDQIGKDVGQDLSCQNSTPSIETCDIGLSEIDHQTLFCWHYEWCFYWGYAGITCWQGRRWTFFIGKFLSTTRVASSLISWRLLGVRITVRASSLLTPWCRLELCSSSHVSSQQGWILGDLSEGQMQNKWDREAESKVALSVAACEVLVPKSSRIALLI